MVREHRGGGSLTQICGERAWNDFLEEWGPPWGGGKKELAGDEAGGWDGVREGMRRAFWAEGIARGSMGLPRREGGQRWQLDTEQSPVMEG